MLCPLKQPGRKGEQKPPVGSPLQILEEIIVFWALQQQHPLARHGAAAQLQPDIARLQASTGLEAIPEGEGGP